MPGSRPAPNLLLSRPQRFAMTEHPSLGPTRRHRPLRAASLECLRAPWTSAGDEMSARPRLLLTMGDVAGIGPEIIARAWPALQAFCRPVVLGDEAWLRRALALVPTAAE